MTIPLAALCGRYVVVRVTGRSMTPSLWPGDRVLVRRGAADDLRVGTIAVARVQRPPGRPAGAAPGWHWVIKRVAALPGDRVPCPVRPVTGMVSVVPEGKLVLLSDNPAGTDSRRWGFVPAGDLLGQVIAQLPRNGPGAGPGCCVPGQRRGDPYR